MLGDPSTARNRGRHCRWPSASIAIALTAALTLAAVGCSPDRATDKGAGALSATLSDSTKRVAVVDGDDPGEVSVGVSRALFAAAPVVVVAQADDKAGLEEGAAQATRLGVPLLLIDADEQLAAGASTSPSAATPSAAAPARGASALKAEIARLGAGTVLAMSPAVAATLGQQPGARVVTDAREVPDVSLAHGAPGLTVLVRSGKDEPGEAAATASARAVRAKVVSVASKDLRGDPEAIAALAKHHPNRVLAVGPGFGPVDRLSGRLDVAETGIQLPGGGQVIFPGRRLVALYGHPGTPSLGVLGEQGLSASISRAKKVAAQYNSLSSVPVVPAFEIIATTAQAAPGADGDYSGESSVDELRPWVQKARDEGVYVVLDLQPGRASFLDQAKLYADLLRLPNVGLALDPEWRLTPQQRPLGQIGGVDAKEVNSVITWLADLTAQDKLPQKLLVLHQFQLSMIRHEDNLDLDRDEVQVLVHMDGQGTPALKAATWQAVTGAAPRGMPFGWKNFYDEDHPMLSPAQTMTKKPTPLMISYQ